jgi:hypothetical protein
VRIFYTQECNRAIGAKQFKEGKSKDKEFGKLMLGKLHHSREKTSGDREIKKSWIRQSSNLCFVLG